MNRNFLKKKEGVGPGGGSFGTISKSTVVLFCYSIREGGGWVVIFRNFEKSAYVPSKKYLHPPPPPAPPPPPPPPPVLTVKNCHRLRKKINNKNSTDHRPSYRPPPTIDGTSLPTGHRRRTGIPTGHRRLNFLKRCKTTKLLKTVQIIKTVSYV